LGLEKIQQKKSFVAVAHQQQLQAAAAAWRATGIRDARARVRMNSIV
jgi:hypothetical protein